MEFNNTIFCYSGTGNSLASAKQISQHFNMPVKMITEELVAAKPFIDGNFCIIIYPSYAYGAPVSVRNFIKSSSFNVAYMVLLTTYGSKYGGTLAEAIRLLKKKKQKVSYSDGIKCVENYVPIFGLTKEEKAKKLIETQHKRTEELIPMLEQRICNKRTTFKPFSAIVSKIFRTAKPLFPKFYRVKNRCNGCGLCTKICPANAIRIVKKGKRHVPKFRALKCDHCQGCLQLCPSKAIRYVRVRPNTGRYKHSTVSLNELIKR